jgi:hypothetical protein
LLLAETKARPGAEMTEPDILRDSGVDFLAVVVDRRDVERSDVDPTLKVLWRLLQDRETVVRFRGRIDLGFAGYDDDVRELYQIDEVRNFLGHLDKKFPFWFYFLNLLNGTLVMILLSQCQYSRNSDGMFVIDPIDQEKFFVEHGRAVTWLFDTYSLDEKEYEVLTAQIANYMEQRRLPPIIH